MKHFSKFLSETYHAKKENIPAQKRTTDKARPDKPAKPAFDIQKDTNIPSFMRSGLVVLSVILLASIAIAYGSKITGIESVTSVLSNRISNKELPIYCVDTPEKKVALSFDAAWAESYLLEKHRGIF